jgi:hypothetical protein
MNIKRTSFVAAAALAMTGAVGMAQQYPPQTPPQTPTQARPQTPSETPPQAASVTFAGCVQKESSVIKRSPVAGNVGMDDEFVLTNSIPALSADATAPKPDAAKPSEPTGTSGSVGNFGIVYRLTGDREKELKSFVGQRVEITGLLKDKEKMTDKMSSVGTSSKDITPDNTAEITVDAIKPVSGSCAPAIK